MQGFRCGRISRPPRIGQARLGHSVAQGGDAQCDGGATRDAQGGGSIRRNLENRTGASGFAPEQRPCRCLPGCDMRDDDGFRIGDIRMRDPDCAETRLSVPKAETRDIIDIWPQHRPCLQGGRIRAGCCPRDKGCDPATSCRNGQNGRERDESRAGPSPGAGWSGHRFCGFGSVTSHARLTARTAGLLAICAAVAMQAELSAVRRVTALAPGDRAGRYRRGICCISRL